MQLARLSNFKCLLLQVKRKRKEHRSLDSILFEDDSDELEYFDVLNLLPLSNVRLEIDEPEPSNKNVIQERNGKEPLNRESKSNPTVISVSAKKDNDGGSEKCSKHHSTARITEIVDVVQTKSGAEDKKPEKRGGTATAPDSSSQKSEADKGITSFHEIAKEKRNFESTSHTYNNNFDLPNKKEQYQTKAVVEVCHSKLKQKPSNLEKEDFKCNNEKKEVVNICSEKNPKNKEKPKVEETEETKSLWISDNEEAEEMSRRPQVLKIIDNDVTKPKSLRKTIQIEVTSSENDVAHKENVHENNTTDQQTFRTLSKPDLIYDHIHETQHAVNSIESDKEKERISVENARSFFEKKSTDKEQFTNGHGEGRFERIVKETSNIFGKACNVVKGSLGFEARSESSDLGLGSEIGSDSRRLSVDENTNIVDERINQKQSNNSSDRNNQFDEINDKNQKNCTNLTRSRSCIDSIESQDSDEPEFDHVRYKIVKSNVFSKNIFNNSKKDVTYDGLMQYLREYSFQDLIMDNNVVIIEPVRAEVERKPSFNETKHKSSFNSKVSTDSLEKIKTTDLTRPKKKKDEKGEINHFAKAPRQSSLRKHFFYQPIRVNRELNDDELPDPDTVRNVRKMFEETMKDKLKVDAEMSRDCSTRKSVSMKDLRTIENRSFECGSEKSAEESR